MGKNSNKTTKARRNNPPRGGPGVLVLSETGRESKCQREALEILRHYFYAETKEDLSDVNSPVDEKDTHKDASNLTLEQEIALLKRGASADAVLSGNASDPTEKHKAPFRVYDTGCRGTVFIMCTLPDSEIFYTNISTEMFKNTDLFVGV
jgi:hypothetical protein